VEAMFAIFAMSASLQSSDGGLGQLMGALPFVLILVIFYFLLFLPMQRKQKQQREMLEGLKNGDRVVTTGGLRGTIVSVKEDCLHLRVPPQDIRLEIVRSAVAAVESPGEK
jgi:preprotein translocase subunit YajC